MEKILNLTQHMATPEQIAHGVEDLPEELRSFVIDTLTFTAIPSGEEITSRAIELALLAQRLGYKKVMIGGAPFFMSALEYQLFLSGIQALYAFSVRTSTETQRPDGTVEKVVTFKHQGFIKGEYGFYTTAFTEQCTEQEQ